MPNRLVSKYPTPTPVARTLVELLQTRAVEQADQPAFHYLVDGQQEGLHLTYRQLHFRARAIAALLQSYAQQSNSNADERAVLLYPPGIDYIAAFFGCLYAGVIAVP